MATSDPIADNVQAAVDLLKSIDAHAADLADVSARQLDALAAFAAATKSAFDRIVRELDHAANAAAIARNGPTGRNQPQQQGAGRLEDEVRRAADALYHAAQAATNLLQQVTRADSDEEEDGKPPPVSDKAAAVLNGVARSLGVLAGASLAASVGIVTLTTSLVSSLTHWTEAFNPAQTYLATLAVRDLTATLGRLLMPALDAAVQMTRTLADTLISLGPESAKLVSGLVLAGAAFAATALLAAGVAAAINFATGGLAGLLGTLSALVVGSTAFGAVMDTTGGVMESLKQVIESLAPAIAVVAEVAVAVVEALAPLIEALAGTLVPILQLLAGVVQILAVVLTPLVVVLNGFAVAIGWIADKLLRFLRWVGVLNEPDREPVRRGGSVGAAAGPTAQFSSAESYAQRAYAAAYSAGLDPVVAAVDRSADRIVRAIERGPAGTSEVVAADGTRIPSLVPLPPRLAPAGRPGAPAPAPG